MLFSIGKIYKFEKWEKQFEDEEIVVDFVVVEEIMDIELVKDVIKQFQLFYLDDKFIEVQFLFIRDFLIVRIVLENCQRLGSLENVRLVDL